jgi:hypothetical protein
LRLVRVGLPLVAFGVALLWILFAWTVLGLIVNSYAAPREAAEGQPGTPPPQMYFQMRSPGFTEDWPAVVTTVLWPTFLGLQILGQVLCLTTPRQWRLRSSEAPALAVNVLHLVLFLALLPQLWTGWAEGLFWACLLLGPALHLVFVINFAPRIDQEPLARRGEVLTFLLLLLLVFPVVFEVGALAFGPPRRDWEVVGLLALMAAAILAMVAILVRYMNLHLAVYHAIPSYLETYAEHQKLEKAGWVDPPGGGVT